MLFINAIPFGTKQGSHNNIFKRMKFVALLSGGKDSILALLMAYRFYHEPVVVANIAPSATLQSQGEHEVDSYMYQTVGHEAVEQLTENGLQLPLRRAFVEKNRAVDQSMNYTDQAPDDDEVECLYRLLKAIKEEFPEVKGVSSGAILSNYQRHRVENVCYRLGLVSLAYLWHRPAREILDMADALCVKAILVKTASGGLIPQLLLGKTLKEVRPTLEKMEKRFGGHMAGEGGEFESFVLDCPLFLKTRLIVESMKVVMVDDNEYSPSGHLRLESVSSQEKTPQEKELAIQLCSRLQKGDFIFPSDVMPALSRASISSLSSSSVADAFYFKDDTVYLSTEERMNEVVRVVHDVSSLSLFTVPLCHSSTVHSPFVLVPYVSEEITVDTLSEEQIKTCFEAVHQRVAEALTSVVGAQSNENKERTFLPSWNETRKRCLHYLIVCPHPRFIPVIDAVYCSYACPTSPPGCTLFSCASTEGSRVRLWVLAARHQDPYGSPILLERVHNQSISCWAAGRRGPYSQGWKVYCEEGTGEPSGSLDERAEEKVETLLSPFVFVGGLQGVVPSTSSLATSEELPITVDDSSSSFGGFPDACERMVHWSSLHPESAMDEKGEKNVRVCLPKKERDPTLFFLSFRCMREMAAQFAFAFANAVQYGSIFRKEPQDATVFTVMVSPIFVEEFTCERAKKMETTSDVVPMGTTCEAMQKIFSHLFLSCCPHILDRWKFCAVEQKMTACDAAVETHLFPAIEILLNADFGPSSALVEIFMKWI